jgi:CheY-like chemotaxis protein
MKIKSVLIVDDDSISNFINVRLFKNLNIGDEISIATNGKDALKRLEEQSLKTTLSPDLILLDINMPVMDGFEFLKKFHSINFSNKDKVTIAILTTSSHQKDKIKMEELGVKHYLSKPLNEESILNLLNNIK